MSTNGASTLLQRRHTQALADMQKAIEQREKLFAQIARVHSKIWKLGRQVQRYEKILVKPKLPRAELKITKPKLPPAPLRKRKNAAAQATA